MNFISVRNQYKPHIQKLRVKYCNGFLSKLFGLMFIDNIAEDFGILLVNNADTRMSSAIHMFFMNFDITLIWINSNKKVVDKKIAKRWFPLYLPTQKACYVLETHINRYSDYNIGDTLEFGDDV